MTVRETEKRIPQGVTVADMGQANANGDYVLVSYLTSPISIGSAIDYVVFATNGAPADEYCWRFLTLPNHLVEDHSEIGLMSYKPDRLGEMRMTVDVIVQAHTVATLALSHSIVERNQRLEILIDGKIFPSGRLMASGGDPQTSREIVNDFVKYVAEVTISTSNKGIHPLVLAAVVYKESLFRPKSYNIAKPYALGWAVRNYELSLHAEELNDDAFVNIIDHTKNSLGVCQMKPQTAAMVLGLSPWAELPKEISAREKVKRDIYSQYLALPKEKRIDIFNLLRFPKTNISLCARLLERLKNGPRCVEARAPNLTPDELLGDENAIKVISTEYNIGPVMTENKVAKPSHYGADVYTLIGSPYLRPFFLEPNLVSKPGMNFVRAHQNGYRVESRTAMDIDSIVIHTAEDTYTSAIIWFQDKNAGVSSHFVVSSDGQITQMVEVKDVAFASNYYNDRSIGIECEGYADQGTTWTDELTTALVHLAAWLCQDYSIQPFHPTGSATSLSNRLDAPGIVGHSQIHGFAPYDKRDPGPHFNWESFIRNVHRAILGI
jgi:hypothetical protein